VASLVVVLIGVLITGAWIGHQIESSVLDRTAGITALYVESVVGLEPAESHLEVLSLPKLVACGDDSTLRLNGSDKASRAVALRQFGPRSPLRWTLVALSFGTDQHRPPAETVALAAVPGLATAAPIATACLFEYHQSSLY
jgi:hypothetical protein